MAASAGRGTPSPLTPWLCLAMIPTNSTRGCEIGRPHAHHRVRTPLTGGVE